MNPFEKRATEYIRDDLAFLPYVTPEPLLTHLEPYAREDVLFDRLAVLIGSPGSGKTTLARLFLFPTLTTLLNNKSLVSQNSLTDALSECKAIEAGVPIVAGCRIPMESDYRDCWELPYDASVRENLLYSLLQARAMLAWIRGFEEAGYTLDRVRLIPRADAMAALDAIGGEDLAAIREFARLVERDVYAVIASLLPPAANALPHGATLAYRPFDVVEGFQVSTETGAIRLKPLLICDDAHVLHPSQFDGLVKWLARREIRVARWILTRVDALRPNDVLRPGETKEGPGLNRSRDLVPVWMQSSLADRNTTRRAFRKIAKDMSDRYLQQMPVFSRRNLTSLADLLDGANPDPLPKGKLAQLEESLNTGARKSVGRERRKEIESLVDGYLSTEKQRAISSAYPEIRLMMIRILMERFLKRVPQNSLFNEGIETEPSVPLKADSGIRNAAVMQLHLEYGRPFYFGFETLCDAASENAERFLRLAGRLVAQLETLIIRKRKVDLSAAAQESLLEERAVQLLADEDFPERTAVMRLCEFIASQCIVKAREPNASLCEGPNAWGILQTEFDAIATDHHDLARVLQHGVAYNMFTLVRDYGVKNQIWCLIELSGSWCLRSSLSLKRGQFLERKVKDLLNAVSEKP